MGDVSPALELRHVGCHALVGGEEVLSGLEGVGQVGSGSLGATSSQQLGGALTHLYLQGDPLFQVILLEVVSQLLDVVEIQVLEDLYLAEGRLPQGEAGQRA